MYLFPEASDKKKIYARLKDRHTGTKEKYVLSSAFTISTGRTLFHLAASKVAQLFAKFRSFIPCCVCC